MDSVSRNPRHTNKLWPIMYQVRTVRLTPRSYMILTLTGVRFVTVEVFMYIPFSSIPFLVNVRPKFPVFTILKNVLYLT